MSGSKPKRQPTLTIYLKELKMIEGQTEPLVQAAKVLKMSTLRAASKAPYNRFGWAILDRWAMNSPRQLIELEAQGEVILLGRLLEQQTIEQEALTNATPEMAPHETLAMREIESELV